MGSSSDAGRSLAAGKLPVELLTRLLVEQRPPPPELRLGAAIGEDACGIDIGDRLVVAAADPITLTSEDAGRLAVLVNANDVAVTGARPRWFLAVVLLPPGSREVLVEGIFSSIRLALHEVGAYLVGGHTEVTPAVTRPIVIGHMIGVAENGIVRTGGAETGDAVVQVKPVPIEGAAVLAAKADHRGAVAPGMLEKARTALERPGIAVVEPAILAAELGATALHDPTEGGLAAGLHELAGASHRRLVIDRASVLWFAPGLAVCEALEADPWTTLASGTLLATFPAATVDEALAAVRAAGYEATRLGRVDEGSGVEDEEGTPIPSSVRDEVARLLSDGER